MNQRAFLLLALALAACSSVEEAPPEPTVTRFVPEGDPTSPSITLREAEITPDRLTLQVVAHGVTNLYGLAFRIETDPAVLGLENFNATSSWPTGSLARGTEARPGLGYYVVTAKGQQAGREYDEDVLANIVLRRVSSEDAALRFVVARSALIDDAGAVQQGISWLGGDLRTE